MLINIISSLKGGGAELLVRELHKIYRRHSIDAHAIYFTGGEDVLEENEIVLGVSPRSPLNILRIRKILKQLSKSSDSDLTVHVHLTWPFFYVTLASFGVKGIKLVYTEHSTNNKRRSVPLLWVLERLFYARFSRIICISEGVEKTLARWVGSKIERRLVIIPNGSRIYSMAERSTLQERLPSLVSIGSLSSRKNFATAIRAIAELKDEVGSYYIIGEGPQRRQLEQIIQKEHLESKVYLMGWSDAIEAHLHAADIQLIPSLWEGFGLVAVEGMSTGLPVVASNVAGLREVLDESNLSISLVSQPEDVDEWVAAIRKTIADIHAEGAGALGRLSRRQAEKFTLDQMAKRYLDLYNQL